MSKKESPGRNKRVFIVVFIAFTIIAVVAGYVLFVPIGPTIIEVVHWTTLVEADRQIILNQLADDFMVKNPNVKVIIIPVNEDDFSEMLAEAKENSTLPDTIRVGFEYAGGWTLDGILDPNVATDIIEELGENTWGAGTLKLFKSPTGGEYVAVPTDGWLQGIWYRKDLFAAAGLQPPTTWDNILNASRVLNRPSEGFYGIVLGSHPEATYTQQNYECFALSYDVRAFDYFTGEPELDTPEQAVVLDFYIELADYTPPHPLTWREANEYYLTGKCAMMMYSTYIIDDILGIDKRDWTPIPSLAEKTGVITFFEGPTGKKSAWGNLNGFGITTTADKEAASAWIKYILDERLYDYISMSIVGMMPARTTIMDEWREHEYFKEYAAGLADQISSGFIYVERWGYQDGKVFPMISKLYSELLIPTAIDAMLNGTFTSSEAVEWIQAQMESN